MGGMIFVLLLAILIIVLVTPALRARFGRKLFEAAPEPKTFILLESAGHNDLYDHGAAEQAIRFLDALGR